MKSTKTLFLSGACVVFGGVAHAATISGTLQGFEDVTPSAGEPISLTGAPYDFQAGFVDADDAGVFRFDFVNTLDTQAVISVADFTILQNDNELFEGGVTTSFGGMVEMTMEGVLGAFVLSATADPGEVLSLIIDYGNPVGSMGGLGPVGPDIDFVVNTQVVPVPAALPLLAGGLGLLGFVSRRRKKAGASAN